MNYRPIRAVPFALALATLSFSAVAAKPGDANTVCDARPSHVLRGLLAETNKARAKGQQCGSTYMAAAPKLRWNRSLQRAARSHSRDMARNNFFSHTGSDGSKSWDRAVNEGYVYRTIGENIAAGYRNVGSVQAGWLKSPGHCRNMMNPAFTQMGVGCTQSSGTDYGTYWTVVFGRPR